MAQKSADEFARSNKTRLFELHQAQGAKMVDFVVFAFPMHYGDGILKEHAHTRKAAGLFDVCHMGRLRVTGKAAAATPEHVLPVNLLELPKGHQRYALITNERGGILDHLMVTNAGDHLFVVVNVSRKGKNENYFGSHLEADCALELLDDGALMALQGPTASGVMKRLAPQSAELVFMSAARITVAGLDCFVSRSGYAGEDGLEISLAADAAVALGETLLSQKGVRPGGLGGRGTLRLEAGLCLYGQVVHERTSRWRPASIGGFSESPDPVASERRATPATGSSPASFERASSACGRAFCSGGGRRGARRHRAR